MFAAHAPVASRCCCTPGRAAVRVSCVYSTTAQRYTVEDAAHRPPCRRGKVAHPYPHASQPLGLRIKAATRKAMQARICTTLCSHSLAYIVEIHYYTDNVAFSSDCCARQECNSQVVSGSPHAKCCQSVEQNAMHESHTYKCMNPTPRGTRALQPAQLAPPTPLTLHVDLRTVGGV